MPITIGSNIASLKVQRQLERGTSALSRVFERLASGQRINRASDDAAGLSVAMSLNASSRIYTQAVRNLNDGLSALAIANGALSQLIQITTRQQELAEQSANGIYSTKQRTALANESNALTDEYNRIVKTTSFNGVQLLTGSFANVGIQGGFGTSESTSISIGQELISNDGTFQSATTLSITRIPGRYMMLSDANNDGYLDYFSDSGAGDEDT